MATKKKHKRVNLTPQQLMQLEFNKAEERSLKRIFSTDDAVPSQVVSGDRQPTQSEVMVKTVSPPLRAVLSKPKAASKIISLLLTADDLCALLQVSRSTISRMDRVGSIPGRVTVGGSVRYHREIIEKWLLERAMQ